MKLKTNSDLIQQLAKLSPEERMQVMEKLKAQGIEVTLHRPAQQANGASGASSSVNASIPRFDRSTPIPLSFPQEQIWFLHQLEPESVAYNERVAIQFEGSLDVDQLEQAIHAVVRRHESLRTTFDRIDKAVDDATNKLDANSVVQVIHPFDADVYGLTRETISTVDDTTEVAKWIDLHTLQPFDLRTAPLWRLVLFSNGSSADGESAKTGRNKYILLLVMHHIMADAWSISLFLEEIATCYTALLQGQEASLPQLSVTYADFAGWQRATLQGDTLARYLEFWRQSLADAPTFFPLPTDRPRPPVPSGRGGVERVQLGFELTQKLKTLSREAGVTLYMTLLSAFNVLLARYTSQEDIVIGSVQANRPFPELERLIGHFVNTLAIRTRLPTNGTFHQLLQQMREQIQASYDHQELPFRTLVQALQPERTLSYHPIYQVSFNLHNQPGLDAKFFSRAFAGLVATPLTLENRTSKLDLYLLVYEDQGELIGEFEYNADLFDAATVALMANHFAVLLDGIVSRPDHPVFQLPLLTAAEYQQIVHEWNDTTVDFGEPQTIHALFEQQVEQTPDAIALIYDSDELRFTNAIAAHEETVVNPQSEIENRLTYAALNTRANQLAHHLIELSVQTDTLVAVAMERSIEMVVSLLAILKAGGAYVPIDPTYPAARIRYMLADSATPILLTQSHLDLVHDTALDVASQKTSIIAVDTMAEQLTAQPSQNPESKTSPADLAYVIYTSGSTGQPKGVANQHDGLFNRLRWTQQQFQLTTNDRVLQKTPFSFDVSVWEFFWPLLSGACLVVAKPEGHKDPSYLCELIQDQHITLLHFVPSMLRQFIADPTVDNCTSLRTIITSGEALPLDLAQETDQRLPAAALHNLYGPTEAAIDVSHWAYVATAQTVPIGRPIANTTLYILDRENHLVPTGVSGELHIGGIQLARGYLNRPELTAERFIDHPEFGRLYKTGDLCRWLPDGNIEYIGRTDFQVKIRGFRIELGEIESALLVQEGVREAVVLARADELEDKRLVAYIVAEWESGKVEDDTADSSTLQHFNASTLREDLRKTLPDHMVPSALVFLDEMPLTPNGKLDRKALPAPDYTDAQGEFVAPRTEMEKQVASIWEEVLHIDQVGVHDNFFALGGHSLLATLVISRARSQLNLDVPLKSLFEASQLGDFANLIQQAQTSTDATIASVSRDQPLPLSFAQQRLWFLDQLEPESAFFNMPTVMQLTGQLHVDALEKSFKFLIARHESLRTVFRTMTCEDSSEGGSKDNRDGEPIQIIQAPSAAAAQFRLTVRLVASEEEAHQLAQAEVTTPFNLSEGPLLWVQLLQIAEEDSSAGLEQSHLLVVTMHHIVSDGWSLGVLVEELNHAYRAYTQGEQPTLPDLPIQYADFAVWQRNHLRSGGLDAQLSYWQEQLTGTPALLELPTDYPRPPVQSYQGAHYTFELSADITTKLNQLAQHHNATLFMVLLTAFSVLLARYSRQTDIAVGTLIANRNRAEIEELIGFFLNTLVLRTQLEGNPSFTELLAQVRQNTLAAYDHQDVPFEQLVDQLSLERTLSYSPLFQVMMVLQNADEGEFILPNLTATMQPIDFPFARYDLSLYLTEGESDLQGIFEYSTALFTEETIARMANHFVALMEGIVAVQSLESEQPVLQLPILTAAEYDQIVHDWNDTAVDFGEPQTFHALFEQQVVDTPNAVALVFGDEQFTYAELNRHANQLAHYLRTQAVGGPGSSEPVVGVCMERCPETVISLLAIFKAGGVYVPLDPALPQDRVTYMLTQAAAQAVLTKRQYAERISSPVAEQAIKIIALDTDQTLISQQSTQNLPHCTTPQSLGYVIYTSGSTGLPKGAMVEHRGMVNHLYTKVLDLNLTADDKIAETAPQSFDISIWQFLAGLLVGGAVHIFDDETVRNPARLLARTEAEQITILEVVPSLFRYMLDELAIPKPPVDATSEARRPHFAALRWLLLTGEALPPQLCNEWFAYYPDIPLMNAYGPTECSDDVTHHAIHGPLPPDAATVPIGRTVANMQLYILDNYLQPVPVGVPGELYVGGIGVGRGYLNDPERTAQAFMDDPFGQGTGRFYKTGDLCRWLLTPDGIPIIEYLGRTDFQVKIRGFRIELGEIEQALLAQDGVREAVVLAREDDAGDKRLVAYVVGDVKIEAMQQYLAPRLPDYMIPSTFVMLEAMPLTPNGKLDRRALPAPGYVDTQAEFVAPRSDIEEQLAAIWQEVLHADQVGVYDNFFALGGHSLLATRVVSQIRGNFRIELPLASVFEAKTLEELAIIIAARTQASASDKRFVHEILI